MTTKHLLRSVLGTADPRQRHWPPFATWMTRCGLPMADRETPADNFRESTCRSCLQLRAWDMKADLDVLKREHAALISMLTPGGAVGGQAAGLHEAVSGDRTEPEEESP